MVQPDAACFGEKDFQQLRLVEKMVEDLKFPVEILRGKTVREEDGLAMSSRNVRLSDDGRPAALGISQGLAAASAAYKNGKTNPSELVELAKATILEHRGIELEYLDIVDEDFKTITEAKSDSRILASAFVEGVRLIDNCSLGEGLS